MPRGRPRKSNPDAVLDAVMMTFWENGYGNTSMNDLAARSGMAKPGLYANFGDKDALFEQAVQNYLNKVTAPMLTRLRGNKESLHDALAGFLLRVTASATNATGPKGCFVAACLLESAHMSERLRDFSKSINEQRTQAFQQRLDEASCHELPPHIDRQALAEFFTGQFIALTAMARAGHSQATLQGIVATALTVLPRPGDSSG